MSTRPSSVDSQILDLIEYRKWNSPPTFDSEVTFSPCFSAGALESSLSENSGGASSPVDFASIVMRF
jgi:hypothetical protein